VKYGTFQKVAISTDEICIDFLTRVPGSLDVTMLPVFHIKHAYINGIYMTSPGFFASVQKVDRLWNFKPHAEAFPKIPTFLRNGDSVTHVFTVLMSQEPAAPPPPGVIPDFDNPSGGIHLWLIVTQLICIPVVACFVITRLYVKLFKQHVFYAEDCKQLPGLVI
jgi:hypothetical protein